MSEPPDDVAEALYAGDPKAFVAARDAAVKELRGAGRREEATAVKALARPTVAAAGVNHTVRSGALEELWAAGDALAAAQAALLAGDADAAALREAKAAHEDALGAAVERAGEGARETLRAASVDTEVRAAVAGGRLVREVEPGSGAGGFGGFTGFAAASGGRKRAGKQPSAAPRPGKARGGAKQAVKPATGAGDADKAAAAEKACKAKEARQAEEDRAVQAAEEEAVRAKERAKQRKALKRKLETARARATRSAAATGAAREALDRAEAASSGDADKLEALGAELEALGE